MSSNVRTFSKTVNFSPCYYPFLANGLPRNSEPSVQSPGKHLSNSEQSYIVIKSIGPPLNKDQYKEYIEYVEEEVGGDGKGGGPEERYEIINAEPGEPNSGAPNAQVVDDVDLNQFDQNGNYIGAPAADKQAQPINAVPHPGQNVEYRQLTPEEFKKAIAEDNDHVNYEDEEEADVSHSNSMNSQNTRIGPISKVKPPLAPTNNHKPPTLTKDPYQAIEEKYPGIFERLQNSNKNDAKEKVKYQEPDVLVQPAQNKPALIQNKNIEDKPEYEYIEDPPEVIYDSGKQTQPQTKSPVEHMDIQPAMSAQNPVVITQISGPKGKELGAVQITEQKVDKQTSSIPTPHSDNHKGIQNIPLKYLLNKLLSYNFQQNMTKQL